ncbi:right-handed parallel beta-helix repeat-containing protein [Streptomyces sp. NPDC004838]
MTNYQKNHRSPHARRRIGCLVGVASVMASGLAAAAPAAAVSVPHGGARHIVYPGGSIQVAVDAARPGDTVLIRPGVYRESVQITKEGLTLRGAGPGTVLMPAPIAVTPSPTPIAGRKRAVRAVNACAQKGNGICVTGTEGANARGVSIRSLKVTGFAAAGLWASRTDRLSVRQVTAEKNGTWGISLEKSTRASIRDNASRDNRDAGVFLANTVGEEGGATDTLGTVVANNELVRNRVGINIKRVRNLTARENDISGNCAGIFVVSDESKPAAGAMTIRNNDIHKNNKLCPATPRLPAIQGSGIVLTGSDATVIRNNRISENVGSAPMSGGIVLAKSFVGATNDDNVIEHNQVTGNRKADLVHRGPGKGNTFTGNVCGASEPAGMCR